MKRREFLKAVSISAAAISAGPLAHEALAAPRTASGKRPNVLFIFSDMQRAYSMGCYGDANARTPRLDKFASEGARFDAAISNTPVCCPFRASLMSGLYAHHHGTMSNGSKFTPTAKCLGETFRDAGYVTGYIGKWHIPAGDKDNRFGFPEAGSKYGHYETRHDVKPLADLMVEFIEEHGKSEKPWLCMLSWLPPHSPYKASPGYAEHFKNVTLPPNVAAGAPRAHAERALPDYYGMIEEIDEEFGRIMETLEKAGAAEDTIVVYTSDHGDMIGCQGYGAKRWPYEESARIPLLIRYPRAIKPGQVIKDPIGAPDFYPTLAGLAGLQAPAGLDGRDFSGVITRGAQPPRDHVYLEMAYAYVPWPGWRALRTRQYAYARTHQGPWFLYDVEKDPFQMKNLVADPACKALVEEFDARLAAVMKETGDSWEAKVTTGDLDKWLPGGPKQRSNYMGVSWPGCAVKEMSANPGEEFDEDGAGGKTGGKKKGGKGARKAAGKGGGKRKKARAAAANGGE